jgi:hypothetical protein
MEKPHAPTSEDDMGGKTVIAIVVSTLTIVLGGIGFVMNEFAKAEDRAEVREGRMIEEFGKIERRVDDRFKQHIAQPHPGAVRETEWSTMHDYLRKQFSDLSQRINRIEERLDKRP